MDNKETACCSLSFQDVSLQLEDPLSFIPSQQVSRYQCLTPTTMELTVSRCLKCGGRAEGVSV